MNILIVGKFPPIQGGVSMRVYWTAHSLAERGHDVCVITNSDDVDPQFRIFMTQNDWLRCEAECDNGRVRVHRIASFDRSQRHIPPNDPVVTKLASLGMEIGAENGTDVVFSYYLEPYAVAGHLIAQKLDVPHVVKTAGSDVGRLWLHAQFQPLYNHVLRSATIVFAQGDIADRLLHIGVNRQNLCRSPGFSVPDSLFHPNGPRLNVNGMMNEVRSYSHFDSTRIFGNFREEIRYIGIYGKLGKGKAIREIIQTVARLVGSGHEVGLLILGESVEESDRRQLLELIDDHSLKERVVKLPFLPHWRVPEFIRRCYVVCCLEQESHVPEHNPVIAREVLACGGCLVASTEILRKLPKRNLIIDRYNCVAVENVRDVEQLTKKLSDLLSSPDRVSKISERAREYASSIQIGDRGWKIIEASFEYAIKFHKTEGKSEQPEGVKIANHENLSDRLLRFVVERLPNDDRFHAEHNAPGSTQFDEIEMMLARVATRVGSLGEQIPIYSKAIHLARLISGAISEMRDHDFGDPLFRLGSWSRETDDDAFDSLVPAISPWARIIDLDYDVRVFIDGLNDDKFPQVLPGGPTSIVVMLSKHFEMPLVYVLDSRTRASLSLCDGKRTLHEILNEENSSISNNKTPEVEKSINEMFREGIIQMGCP
jgi:glycosyltransferase involved in cell wall biosynthesis